MSEFPQPPVQILDWAVSGQALPGESESGDAHMVAEFAQGALAAVVDGLGHGKEAAEAARAAVRTMERCAHAPVDDIILQCHAELRKTRGAVISLASFDATTNRMSWLGVGNIEGFLFRPGRSGVGARESLLLRSGVVGYQLPPLRAASLPVSSGDILMLATDGIFGSFGYAPLLHRPLQEAADDILRRYGKETDDAMVLVAQYLGFKP